MDVDPQKVIARLLEQNKQLLLQVSMLQVAVDELQEQVASKQTSKPRTDQTVKQV